MTDTSSNVPPDMREQVERLPEVEAERAALAEESALKDLEIAGLRAGIDLSTRQGKAWASTFEGDWANPDEMKTDFNKMFGESQPEPTQTPDLPQAEATPDPFRTGMTEDRRNVSEGGAIPPGQPQQSDPWKEGYDALYKGRQDGRPEVNNRAEVFNRVIDAAVDGDERVIWSEEHRAAWMEETGAHYHR